MREIQFVSCTHCILLQLLSVTRQHLREGGEVEMLRSWYVFLVLWILNGVF